MSHLSPRHPRARVGLIAATLSVFLLGNNYCLVAAVAGSTGGHARLACHAEPGAAPAQRASCCHPVGPSQREGVPGGPMPGFPCCMLVATPSQLQLEKPAADHAAPAAFLPDETSPPRTAFHGRAPEQHSDPPPARSHALLRSRAPPLS